MTSWILTKISLFIRLFKNSSQDQAQDEFDEETILAKTSFFLDFIFFFRNFFPQDQAQDELDDLDNEDQEGDSSRDPADPSEGEGILDENGYLRTPPEGKG